MLGYSLIYRVAASDRDKHVFGGLVWRGVFLPMDVERMTGVPISERELCLLRAQLGLVQPAAPKIGCGSHIPS